MYLMGVIWGCWASILLWGINDRRRKEGEKEEYLGGGEVEVKEVEVDEEAVGIGEVKELEVDEEEVETGEVEEKKKNLVLLFPCHVLAMFLNISKSINPTGRCSI